MSWPHLQWPAVCVSLYPPKGTQWISCRSGVCVRVCEGVCNLVTLPLVRTHSCFTQSDYRLCKDNQRSLLLNWEVWIMWSHPSRCGVVIPGAQVCVCESVYMCTCVCFSVYSYLSPDRNHKTQKPPVSGHTERLIYSDFSQNSKITLATAAMRNSLHCESKNFWKLHIVLVHHRASEEWAHCKLSNSSSRSS